MAFIPSENVSEALLDFLLEQCPLGNSIWHGRDHWLRVLQNGRMLSPLTGANLKVVELFALIHDCRRENEDEDLEHGFKSGDFAKTLQGKWFELQRKNCLIWSTPATGILMEKPMHQLQS